MYLSIVIPCFNAEAYIGATLRAVLAQAGVTLEVIVVDDGSTDDSARQVAEAFPQVRVLRRTNAGVAAARARNPRANSASDGGGSGSANCSPSGRSAGGAPPLSTDDVIAPGADDIHTLFCS